MDSEMIVKLNQDHVKIKGCEYIRDLIRCENCKWYVPVNNSDHGACGSITGRTVYPDDFCSEGEEA